MQVDEEQLSVEEMKERKIMKLLLKVKNGTPPQRKSALRQLTDKARDFGAGPLFNQILPLLMSPTLEDQERHLLVKVRLHACPCHVLNVLMSCTFSGNIMLLVCQLLQAPVRLGYCSEGGIRQTWRTLRDLVDWPCEISCLDPAAEAVHVAHM